MKLQSVLYFTLSFFFPFYFNQLNTKFDNKNALAAT